jgi:predicted nuclease of predicted toxin-antitoxin system
MKLAVDVNFARAIVNGLRRRLPDIDVAFAQDVGLETASDEQILEWAASERRILLTHDKQSLLDIAYLRIARGQPMPGVIYVPQRMPIGQAIADLEIVLSASFPNELENRVIWLPL